jgi:WD40 repeat protein
MERNPEKRPSSLKNFTSMSDLDRFISSKKSFENLEIKIQTNKELSPKQNDFLNNQNNEKRIINDFLKHELFKNKRSNQYDPLIETQPFCQESLPGYHSFREIHDEPFKVLDAPMLQDDFYLNVLDWSSQNILGVGLGNSLYSLNFSNNHVYKLMEFGGGDYVTSCVWNDQGNHIVIGSSKGKVLVMDIVKSKPYFYTISQRISANCFYKNANSTENF